MADGDLGTEEILATPQLDVEWPKGKPASSVAPSDIDKRPAYSTDKAKIEPVSRPLKTAGYGPAYGEYTHDTLYGPGNNVLRQSNVAISPNRAKEYPLGSGPYNAVDDRTGEVVRTGVGIADWSYKHPGDPNYDTVEFWNDRLSDSTGHVHLVKADGWMPSGYVDLHGADTTPPQDSPLQRLRSSNPSAFKGVSDGELLNQFYNKWASHTNRDDYNKWMQDPNGAEELDKGMAPIDRMRWDNPELRNVSDDQIVDDTYNYLVKNKKIDPDVIEKADIRDKLMPPKDWLGKGNQLLREFRWQLNLVPRAFGRQINANWKQAELEGAYTHVKEAFNEAYPGQDAAALTQEYLKLDPHEREKKFLADYNKALANKPPVPPDQLAGQQDPMRLLAKFEDGLRDIEHQRSIDSSIDQLTKAAGEIDTAREGYTPEGMMKAAKTLAQMPTVAAMLITPGIREMGLYAMLHGDNRNAIKAANPGISDERLADLAEKATEVQFPIQWVLALGLSAGDWGEPGAKLAGSFANKILKWSQRTGANVGVSAAEGGATFGVTQIVQNLYAGKDPRSGTGEAILWGSGIAGTGKLMGLTVHSLSRAFKSSPEMRQALGVTGIGHPPEEVDKALKGEPNQIDGQIDNAAADMIESAVAVHIAPTVEQLTHETQRRAERNILTGGGALIPEEENLRIATGAPIRPEEFTPEIVPPGGGVSAIRSPEQQRIEQQRILSGRRTYTELGGQREQERMILSGQNLGYIPALDVVPSQEMIVDTLSNSWIAKNNGDLVAHKQGIDNAMGMIAKADAKGHREIQKDVGDNVAFLANKAMEGAKSTSDYLGIKIPLPKPPKTKEVPLEVVKEKPKSKIAIKVGGVAGIGAKEVKVEDVLHPPVEGEVIPGETLIKHGVEAPEPGPFALGATPFFTQNPFKRFREWFPLKWFEDVTKFFGIWNPEWKNGVSAETTGAIVKSLNSKLHTVYGRAEHLAAEATLPQPVERAPAEGFLHWLGESLIPSRFLENLNDSAKRIAQLDYLPKVDRLKMLNEFEGWVKGGMKSTGSVWKDNLFAFYKTLHDWAQWYENSVGIKTPYLTDYLMHIVDKRDRPKLQPFIDKWTEGWEKPGFTKQRKLPTYQDLIDAGLRPAANANMERLTQIRMYLSRRAVKMVTTMLSLQEQGIALNKEDDPEGYKNATGDNWKEYTTPDDRHYKVDLATHEVLQRAFDVSGIETTAVGPIIKFVGALKTGTTPFRLALSLFHQFHIGHITMNEDLIQAMAMAKDKKLTAKELWWTLGSFATSGQTTLIFRMRKYGDMMEVLRGVKEGSGDQARDAKHIVTMGLSPEVSHERTVQWHNQIFRSLNRLHYTTKKGEEVGFSDALTLGYNMLLLKPYQRLMFEYMIPSAKIMSALRKRDEIFARYAKQGIDLDLPEHEAKWLREAQIAGRSIEARFGEMFYENLLWRNWAKQVGTAIPLSLGWQLGFWRVYGDAITDTFGARNTPGAYDRWRMHEPVVTNNMLYGVMYNATALGFGGLVTYLVGGKIPQNLTDLFYPTIGYDKNGKELKARPPFFSTEWGSIWYHLTEGTEAYGHPIGEFRAAYGYLKNKLNPGLAAVEQLVFENKDFYGRQIYDPKKWISAKWTQNMQSLGAWAARELAPISVESQYAKPNMTDRERLFSWLGFSPAPAHTTRSDIENAIIANFSAQVETTMGKSAHFSDVYDAKKEYQQAILSKDLDGIYEARQHLRSLGASDKVVRDAEKWAHIPPAVRLFGMIHDPDLQMNLLGRMNQKELQLYLPHAQKKVQRDWYRERSGLGTNQVPVGQ